MRVAWVLLLLSTAVAHADGGAPIDEAHAAYRDGVAAFNAGRYDVAELHFLRVYDLTHSAEVLYDAAVVAEKQHRWGDAAERYREYLRDSVKVRDRARIRARIDDLEGRQRRQEEVDKALNEGRTPPEAVAAAPGNVPILIEEDALDPDAAATPPVAPPVAAPAPAQQPVHAADGRPIYKKWWLWAAVGAVVLVAAIVAIAVPLSRAPGEAPTTFPDIGPGAPLVRF
jgi:hypothetical protein